MKWGKSHSVMSKSLWPHGLYCPWDSPDQNTGVGSLSLLQGIFPAKGSNPGLPHCRQILYQLSHKGSPRILELVTYPFSSRLTQELNQGLLHCRWILYQLSCEGSSSHEGSYERAMKVSLWLSCKGLLDRNLYIKLFSPQPPPLFFGGSLFTSKSKQIVKHNWNSISPNALCL